MKRRWIFWAPVVLLLCLLFITVGGAIVSLLWNWLLPPLFGLPRITFWQALGLLALCRILFGGFGLHGGSGSHYRRRWEAMTPDERDRIRERMRDRAREGWGYDPSTSQGGQ